MSGFKCPFCGITMPEVRETYQTYNSAFASLLRGNQVYDNDNSFLIVLHKCPSCDKVCTTAVGNGECTTGIIVPIFPQTTSLHFPDYIPLSIRQDYEEAYAIVNLSPKASATLSRRCLQSMIRDFWEIDKPSLFEEISELKNKISVQQWRVLDGVRRIGNIGAHMEKDINIIVDIEPNEAEKLLKLIEQLLNDWYVARHETDALYTEIIEMDDTKQEARHPV